MEKNSSNCRKRAASGVSAIRRPPEKLDVDRFRGHARDSLHFDFWRWTLIPSR